MRLIVDTPDVRLFQGDCREVLASLPDASVDSCVTDPPYELGFMGRGWDHSGVAYDVSLWTEVLRVLKPGGHLLAFGGTRTWHRLACAVEDAGFELRDQIAWLYGSGFPKSLDVSKAVDATLVHGGSNSRRLRAANESRPGEAREGAALPQNGIMSDVMASHVIRDQPETSEGEHWQGWGTALKPAFEPIIVARKPLDGTVAHNVLTHGVGGLNIGGCRVGDEVRNASFTSLAPASGNRLGATGTQEARRGTQGDPKEYVGRFPPNVVLDDSQAAELDDQSGVLTTGRIPVGTLNRGKPAGIFGEFKPHRSTSQTYGDTGGASRYFPTFHWQAKAPTSERPNVDGVQHPTVKPLELMRWLVRLVTPRGGLVLEPFAGSGTTLQASLIEGDRVVAAEITPEYIPLIRQRIEKPIEQTLDLFGGAA